jgi:hypothetical protein
MVQEAATMNAPKLPISLNRALDMMRRPGTRLVKMYTNAAREGFAHYIVPGGYVAPEIADKIKAHPLVRCSHDGLFPGQDQTWKLGGEAAS